MAASALREMVLRQVLALIRQFNHPMGNEAYIGVKTLNYLEQRAQVLGGRIEPVPRQARERALVFIDSTGEPELWCRPRHKGGPGGGFYETDWNNFCKDRFGVDFKSADTSMLNIDHLYPETTGMMEGLSHVRVTALNGPANQNLGRTIEKHMANRPAPSRKVVHKATFATLAKVAGATMAMTLPDTPGAPIEKAKISQLFSHFAKLGLLEDNPEIQRLDQHLTRWSVTRIQGGDADAIGNFR